MLIKARIRLKKVTKVNMYKLNPIPTGLGHVTLIYGLIPPMAGRNRVKRPSHTMAAPDYYFD